MPGSRPRSSMGRFLGPVRLAALSPPFWTHWLCRACCLCCKMPQSWGNGIVRSSFLTLCASSASLLNRLAQSSFCWLQSTLKQENQSGSSAGGCLWALCCALAWCFHPGVLLVTIIWHRLIQSESVLVSTDVIQSVHVEVECGTQPYNSAVKGKERRGKRMCSVPFVCCAVTLCKLWS